MNDSDTTSTATLSANPTTNSRIEKMEKSPTESKLNTINESRVDSSNLSDKNSAGNLGDEKHENEENLNFNNAQKVGKQNNNKTPPFRNKYRHARGRGDGYRNNRNHHNSRSNYHRNHYQHKPRDIIHDDEEKKGNNSSEDTTQQEEKSNEDERVDKIKCKSETQSLLDQNAVSKERLIAKDPHSTSTDTSSVSSQTENKEYNEQERKIDETKIYVGGLQSSVDEYKLRNEFGKFGTICSVTIHKKFYKLFGFVKYLDAKSAQDAIEKMNGESLDGRKITVRRANPFNANQQASNKKYIYHHKTEKEESSQSNSNLKVHLNANATPFATSGTNSTNLANTNDTNHPHNQYQANSADSNKAEHGKRKKKTYQATKSNEEENLETATSEIIAAAKQSSGIVEKSNKKKKELKREKKKNGSKDAKDAKDAKEQTTRKISQQFKKEHPHEEEEKKEHLEEDVWRKKNTLNSQQGTNKNQHKKKHKKYWVKYLPKGSVDPISLEPLHALNYPPFALVISTPYAPVPKWPPENAPNANATPIYHLFDGRVLAYYLVSQLQFIDPLNRRDLTRLELENLDQYLLRHKLGKAGVTEAYDNHGMSISSAGQLGATAAGRNQILQQEARVILDSIFSMNRFNSTQNNRNQGWTNHSNQRNQDNQNRINRFQDSQRQYWRGEAAAPAATVSTHQTNDNGVTASEGGMMFIDDDLNPALRSGVTHSNGSTWANVTSHETRVHSESFPSLPSQTPSDNNANISSQNDSESNTITNTSRSLQTISKLVQKSDPADISKQKAAREAFQQRAALSQMSSLPNFAANTNTTGFTQNLEAKAERNRDMAEALGIQPATVRLNQGWSRPTNAARNEFESELTSTIYQSAFLLFVKEKIKFQDIVKTEKRLKNFLLDDTSPSYSFPPMNRELRKLVHEYGAEYWKLKTESYDLEPRRYIHCLKLLDTRMPSPLLSEIITTWRPDVNKMQKQHVQIGKDSIKQGQHEEKSHDLDGSVDIDGTTMIQERLAAFKTSSDGPKPISLYEVPLTLQNPQPYSCSQTAPFTILAQPSSSRASAMSSGERIKLNLAPRTKPLELPPPSENAKPYEYSKERVEKEMNQKKSKELQKKLKLNNILQQAFNSDDEEEEEFNEENVKSCISGSSSDWDDESALYFSVDENEVEDA